MTPAERDEVLRIAAGFFACEPKDALTMAGMIKLCNAVLRYVPPGEAASARLTDAMAVDRPAPTPTPAPGLDLDAVERAERAMTAGPWFVEEKPRFGGAISVIVDGLPRQVAEANGQALVVDSDPAARQAANAAGIAALRNAAPALIAEVRALRRHYDAAGPDHNLLALLDLYHEREQAALAKLAEAKRLGLIAARVVLDDDTDLPAIAAALEAL